MAKAKFGLGKGLGALIPTTAPAMSLVEIASISPNPHQPRGALDAVALEELAESIRQHGVLQPILVTQVEGSAEGYQIIAGERRWQAAKLAGLDSVPVVIREATPRETLELALVENLQRTDLNPLEEANAYRRLVEEFGLTQEAVAGCVGKSRAAVANSLRLLSLSDEMQRSLARGEISAGHARALLSLPEGVSRRRLWRGIIDQGLSVRQAEQAAKASPNDPPHRHLVTPSPDPDTLSLEGRFRAVLSTKVVIQRGRRGGKLIIYFYSEEELEGIYDTLTG